MHGMFGTLDAEVEVQRTMTRAEFTAFLIFSGKLSVLRWFTSCDPDVDNKRNHGLFLET